MADFKNFSPKTLKMADILLAAYATVSVNEGYRGRRFTPFAA